VIVIASKLRRNTKDVHMNKMNDSKSNSNNNAKKSIDVTGEVDDDSDDNSDSDFDSSCDYNENCETNDDCYVGLEETRSFLYRHFFISIIANQIAKKSNLVFMKTILLYIKEEDNNSRM
jgi:hypothetical protein